MIITEYLRNYTSSPPKLYKFYIYLQQKAIPFKISNFPSIKNLPIILPYKPRFSFRNTETEFIPSVYIISMLLMRVLHVLPDVAAWLADWLTGWLARCCLGYFSWKCAPRHWACLPSSRALPFRPVHYFGPLYAYLWALVRERLWASAIFECHHHGHGFGSGSPPSPSRSPSGVADGVFELEFSR